MHRHLLTSLLAGTIFLGGVPQTSMAAGTASGTTISNTATLGYSLGGVAQTNITSAAATFVVDNKVNLTVAKVADLAATPGATKQALAYTVTNTGNTSQRYALTAVAGAATIASMSNVAIYLDVNGNGLWDAGDTLYVNASTFGDVAADASLKILIVADTPLGATNAQTAIYNLVAQTVDAGTTTVTVDLHAANTGGVDVVFADAAGSAGAGTDTVTDGKHSALATYTVATAALTVSKSALLLCDQFNGIVNPKNIPGSMTQWTLTIANGAAAAAATLTSISDVLQAPATTMDANLVVPTNAATCSSAAGVPASIAGKGFKITASASRNMGGSAGGAAATTSYFTTANDADGVELNAGTVTATFATILPIDGSHVTAGLLNPGESVSVILNVTIN
jgi:hypothetical protein